MTNAAATAARTLTIKNPATGRTATISWRTADIMAGTFTARVVVGGRLAADVLIAADDDGDAGRSRVADVVVQHDGGLAGGPCYGGAPPRARDRILDVDAVEVR